MYLPLLPVDLAMAELDLLAVMGGDGRGQLFLDAADVGLDLGLVQAHHLAVLVHIDIQCL